MTERPKLTAAMVRVLEALERGDRGPHRQQTLVALRELECVSAVSMGGVLTGCGRTVLQAYRIGRSRWGAA